MEVIIRIEIQDLMIKVKAFRNFKTLVINFKVKYFKKDNKIFSNANLMLLDIFLIIFLKIILIRYFYRKKLLIKKKIVKLKVVVK
jgi:hypothetical protein